MINTKVLITGILLTSLLLGCGKNDSDNFFRFQVAGKNYEVTDIAFVVDQMKDAQHLINLSPHLTSLNPPEVSPPWVSIGWQMDLESVEQLAGQNLNLTVTESERAAIFMTKGHSWRDWDRSELHMKIDRIEDNFIEGSFSAKDLKYFPKTESETGEKPRNIDITGQFRLKLVYLEQLDRS